MKEKEMEKKIAQNLLKIKAELPADVTLVAVSKTMPQADIMQAYNAGHKIFGENKVQELEEKQKELPQDIEWHMIGHVQRNKVKYMAPFVSLIHAVDSFKLLREIDKEAKKNNRTIPCLLQIKIAEEESKFGMEKEEALNLLTSEAFKALKNVKIIGLMGMATNTDNQKQVSEEFRSLRSLYDSLKEDYGFSVLSMGMTGDYDLALKHGSNMVRIGSAIFGERNDH